MIFILNLLLAFAPGDDKTHNKIVLWSSLFLFPLTILMWQVFLPPLAVWVGTSIVDYNVGPMERGHMTHDEALSTQWDWPHILPEWAWWAGLVLFVLDIITLLATWIPWIKEKVKA